MEILSSVNIAVTIAALIASGIATLLMGTVKTVRDSNTDLRQRVDELEQKSKRQAEEIGTLRRDNEALQRIVRGDDKLEAIDLHLTEIKDLILERLPT